MAMLKAKYDNKNIKRFVLGWIILFSLSPCTVKEVFFDFVNADYTKPLNRSKAVVQVSSCQYSLNENQQVSVAGKLQFNKQTELIDFYTDLYLVALPARINANYSKTSTGSGPPKYILYKRLKFDMA